MLETLVQFLGGEDALEKEMEPTPVFLPGESHGQRSLEGYSPWGHKSWTRFNFITKPPPTPFIRRTDAKAEVRYFGHLIQRANSLEKTLML